MTDRSELLLLILVWLHFAGCWLWSICLWTITEMYLCIWILLCYVSCLFFWTELLVVAVIYGVQRLLYYCTGEALYGSTMVLLNSGYCYPLLECFLLDLVSIDRKPVTIISCMMRCKIRQTCNSSSQLGLALLMT